MKTIQNNPDISLYDPTTHGNLDYPVQVYYIDLSKTYMKYIRWQWHTEMEFIIVNHGEADVLADNKMNHLTPGQAILVNQNVLHAIHPSGESRNCTLYSLVFHPAFLFGYGNTTLSSKYLTPVISSSNFKTMILDESTPWQEKLLDCINDVIATNMMKKYGYELVTISKLFEIWGILLEKTAPDVNLEKQTSTASLDEMRVKDAIRFVQEHYASPITLESLAESIHVSKSECCRCFKRVLRFTPIEYVMRYRVFAATKLLHSDDPVSHSISDLAFSVGFNSVSYFNKVFKSLLHQTPTEYKYSLNNNCDTSINPFNIMI